MEFKWAHQSSECAPRLTSMPNMNNLIDKGLWITQCDSTLCIRFEFFPIFRVIKECLHAPSSCIRIKMRIHMYSTYFSRGTVFAKKTNAIAPERETYWIVIQWRCFEWEIKRIIYADLSFSSQPHNRQFDFDDKIELIQIQVINHLQ